MIGRFGQLIGRLISQLVGRLISQLIGRFISQLIGRLISKLICRLIGQLIVRFGQLICRLDFVVVYNHRKYVWLVGSKFGPVSIYCVLRTQGSSFKYADSHTSL